MKRFAILSLALIVTFLGVWQLNGEPPVKTAPDRLKPFMQRKLEHAQGVLEGLAREDFEQIAKEAQALSLLSLESEWKVMTTEEYLEQSSDFRRSTRVITQAAREKDVHRAALGYVDLTVSCVECHSYLRHSVPAAKDALVPHAKP